MFYKCSVFVRCFREVVSLKFLGVFFSEGCFFLLGVGISKIISYRDKLFLVFKVFYKVLGFFFDIGVKMMKYF